MSLRTRALKELEELEGTAATIAEALGCTMTAASSALSKLAQFGLVEAIGYEWFVDRAGNRQRRKIYRIAPLGYSHLMGTLTRDMLPPGRIGLRI